MYSSSWWRCTPKVMPFTPQVALAPEEWEDVLAHVCPQFSITPQDVELIFRLLCRARDFPDIVVRLRGTFFPMFDKMPARVLRLLVMHARMYVGSTAAHSSPLPPPSLPPSLPLPIDVAWVG